MTKRNLKIAITPEQPLDEVVGELKRLGYKIDGDFVDGVDNFVHTYRDGTYDFFMSSQLWGKLTTLAELKEMEWEMKSFDEFNRDIESRSRYWTSDESHFAKEMHEEGQQSKQAEVDELIDTIKTSSESEMYLFDELQKVKGERDELRKRIDLALEYIEPSDNINHKAYRDLYKILNGDQS